MIENTYNVSPIFYGLCHKNTNITQVLCKRNFKHTEFSKSADVAFANIISNRSPSLIIFQSKYPIKLNAACLEPSEWKVRVTLCSTNKLKTMTYFYKDV